VGASCFLVDAGLGHAPVQHVERSSRWLPPMISPIPGANTSITATVRPSSLTRM
jgi:hypothetical protein